MDLTNSIAIVTGATRGIGFAFSQALIASGARVYGFARDESKLRETGERLGASFIGMKCDVSDPAQVDRLTKQIAEEAGAINILINNAGVGAHSNIDETSDELWSRLMDTNVTGVFHCARSVVPYMKEQNKVNGFGGHIVNIASVAALIGNPGLTAYNATKFAVKGFSEALMKELRFDGIKVTAMYPGSIQTSFFDQMEGITAHDQMLQPDEIARTLIHILELPDNNLISDIVIRVLRPKR